MQHKDSLLFFTDNTDYSYRQWVGDDQVELAMLWVTCADDIRVPPLPQAVKCNVKQRVMQVKVGAH